MSGPLPEALRELRLRSGMTLRQLAARTGYSASALSAAETGRRVPSWALTETVVTACGEHSEDWRHKWWGVPRADPAHPAPALPPEPVADGADPRRCGCEEDAVTVHARSVLWDQHVEDGYVNINLGVVELRYSARRGAAWGRFTGTRAFDHLATTRLAEVTARIHRAEDNARQEYRSRYVFDVLWGDVLVTRGATLWAGVLVHFAGRTVGIGRTDPIRLP
ncbi:helix-turn-helix domain-containing protein [Plantactinospora siamensis]|uniref:Helix-turn-helix domain-containing protein n=1 Tax=Plantactinospora siamensis TaxID=555372 RepID=A0ABV6P5Z5_9ACTN